MANATPKLGDTFQKAWKAKYGLEFNPDYYYREFGPNVVKALEEQVQAMNDEEIIQFVNDIDSTKLYALPYTSKTPNVPKKIQENISTNPEAISPPKPGAINPNQTIGPPEPSYIYANPNPKPQDTTPPVDMNENRPVDPRAQRYIDANPEAIAQAKVTKENYVPSELGKKIINLYKQNRIDYEEFLEELQRIDGVTETAVKNFIANAPEQFVESHKKAGGLIRSAGENIVENFQKLGGEIKDTAQDIGQGISDQFYYNQAQLNREPGAIPEPKEKAKESDYRPQITEEDGEKKITFSEGLFTRFMKDYSSMMITEYTKQPQTGKDPGPDPLYDMIRGKQGG